MMDLKVFIVLIALMSFCVNCLPVEKTAKSDSTENEEEPSSSTVDRKRRAFHPWSPGGESSNYQRYESFSVWRPPVYQLSRPYYIPVYGVSGQLPMYFPPQPLNYPFRGPPYLPPEVPKETSGETTTKMSIDTRWNPDSGTNMDNDDDDRPIWGGSEVSTSKSVPMRPAYPQPMPSFPPLVHDISRKDKPPMPLSGNTEVDKASIDEIFGTPPTTIAPWRTTTARTRATASRRTTTATPSTTTSVPGPSNCVWAVISCCSLDTEVVSEKCFEQRGCPGPFWDTSPCNKEYAKSALDTVMKYYGSRIGA